MLCTYPLCCVLTQCVVYLHSVLCTYTVCCVLTQCVVYLHSVLCTYTVCCVLTQCVVYLPTMLCTYTLCCVLTHYVVYLHTMLYTYTVCCECPLTPLSHFRPVAPCSPPIELSTGLPATTNHRQVKNPPSARLCLKLTIILTLTKYTILKPPQMPVHTEECSGKVMTAANQEETLLTY